MLKKAIVLARIHTQKYPFLQESIKGIIFLSTPHRGSSSAGWAKMLANIVNTTGTAFLTSGISGLVRTNFLDALDKNSDQLRIISEEFSSQVNHVTLVSFYEMENTQVMSVAACLVSTAQALLGVFIF